MNNFIHDHIQTMVLSEISLMFNNKIISPCCKEIIDYVIEGDIFMNQIAAVLNPIYSRIVINTERKFLRPPMEV